MVSRDILKVDFFTKIDFFVRHCEVELMLGNPYLKVIQVCMQNFFQRCGRQLMKEKQLFSTFCLNLIYKAF